MVALTARCDKPCHSDHGCGMCDPNIGCCVQRERFGNKVGKGQFRGKAVPTLYIYPDCLKAAIRERVGGHLRDYPNPETPVVYIVTLTDLTQARWPGDA